MLPNVENYSVASTSSGSIPICKFPNGRHESYKNLEEYCLRKVTKTSRPAFISSSASPQLGTRIRVALKDIQPTRIPHYDWVDKHRENRVHRKSSSARKGIHDVRLRAPKHVADCSKRKLAILNTTQSTRAQQATLSQFIYAASAVLLDEIKIRTPQSTLNTSKHCQQVWFIRSSMGVLYVAD